MLDDASDERGSDFCGVRFTEPDCLFGCGNIFEVSALEDQREVERDRKRIGRILF